MQIDRTRAYRVKEIADMLDVSPATVYRAIKSGTLDAYKLGAGKSALRISGQSLKAYLNTCAQVTSGNASAEIDQWCSKISPGTHLSCLQSMTEGWSTSTDMCPRCTRRFMTALESVTTNDEPLTWHYYYRERVQ